jgi:membrane protease YdiL (CAAX protease family)
MYDNNSKGISFTAGFFILIAFAIAGLFLATIINTQVWTAMTGKNYQDILSGAADPANANAYKLIQAINAIIGFFFPAVLVASILNRQPIQLLGFSSRITVREVGLVFLITAAALIVGGALGYLNYQIPLPADWKIQFDKMEDEYNQQAQAILGLKNSGDFILSLAVMGLLPAICEETLFRGGLQNFLFRSTRNAWLAIIVVSIIFSLAHFSWYGFLFRLTLGIVLGCLYHYSGKLWLSILAHFLNNALVITICYIYMRQGKPISDVMGETTSSYWGLLALPVLIALLLVYKRIFFNSKLQ